MKRDINRLIDAEKKTLNDDKKQLVEEAERLAMSIALNDYEDVEEIELTIKMMARVRKVKELKG